MLPIILTRKDFGDLTYIRPNNGDLIDARKPEHMGDRTSTVQCEHELFLDHPQAPKSLDLLVLPDGIVITKPFENLPSPHNQVVPKTNIYEAVQTLAPAPAKVLRVMTTGRNPGRRDSIASRETILMAELRSNSEHIEYLMRARGLTSSIIVMCIIFCNTVLVNKLHGHMLF